MKREVIQPHSNDKRYVRRDKEGQFTADQVNWGSRSAPTGAPSPKQSFRRGRPTAAIRKKASSLAIDDRHP